MKYICKSEIYKKYDEYIDNLYGNIEVYSFSIKASDLLKEYDPIAYYYGFDNWLDMMNYTTDESEVVN